MRRVLQTLAALAATGTVVAIAVVGLGLYNTSARKGHLPGVSWVLHTTFKQSVRLRAPAAEEIPGDLASPDRIQLGALHFQTACAFCHAAPGEPRSATAVAMNPPPPHISQAVSAWKPQHMFWIVREGVKMSGMPHWPAEGRDDEVWSVIAYLNAAKDMSGAEQKLLTGSHDSAVSCAICHGENGRSLNSYIPRLDILSERQIGNALMQYRDGARASGFMQEAARDLTDAQIETLSTKFSTSASAEETLSDQQRQSPGGQLATRGNEDVPTCNACHGPDRSADAPIAPTLAGQAQDYMAEQLKLWRDGKRRGGARANLMLKAAQDLSDNDIRALAEWYATLTFDPQPADASR